MNYKVKGANRDTGDLTEIIIDAPSKGDAERAAQKRGLLVETILLTSDKASEPIDYATPTAIAPAQLSPSREAVEAALANLPPEYSGLKAASMVLRIIAALSYVGGGITILLAIVNAITSGSSADWIYVFYGLAMVASGAIQQGLSAACLALRDIARNSFK